HSSVPVLMPLPHAVSLQLLSQPSPLVELPSSHSSPGSWMPLPQPLIVQLLSQPSPLTVLPSSHCSPAAVAGAAVLSGLTLPSPQRAVVQSMLHVAVGKDTPIGSQSS